MKVLKKKFRKSLRTFQKNYKNPIEYYNEYYSIRQKKFNQGSQKHFPKINPRTFPKNPTSIQEM